TGIVAPLAAASTACCRSWNVRAGALTVTTQGPVASSPQRPRGIVVVVLLVEAVVEVLEDVVEVGTVVEVDPVVEVEELVGAVDVDVVEVEEVVEDAGQQCPVLPTS